MRSQSCTPTDWAKASSQSSRMFMTIQLPSYLYVSVHVVVRARVSHDTWTTILSKLVKGIQFIMDYL